MQICQDPKNISRKDLEKIRVIGRVLNSEATIAQAAKVLNVTTRHTRRLLTQAKNYGIMSLIHGLHSKPSNHRISDEKRNHIMSLVNGIYTKVNGVSPTLCSELLFEEYGIIVNAETLRTWMIEAGLHTCRRSRPTIHVWRRRRSSIGELVQMDTSFHHWFGNDEPKLYLINMVDDATGIIFSNFYDSDSTLTNLDCTYRYILTYGIPQALYVDRASHFKVNKNTILLPEDLSLKQLYINNNSHSSHIDYETQFQRAAKELGIQLIFAHSPQAKGRVERSFGSFQKVLVKRCLFDNIKTINDANIFLHQTFLPKWNDKHSIKPFNSFNGHKPVLDINLESALSIVNERKVNNDFTIKLCNNLYQIERGDVVPNLKGRNVRVEQRLDGTVVVKFASKFLHTHLINK